MKVLVTGIDGQVGRALLGSAPESTHVVGLNRSDCDLSDESSIRGAIKKHLPDVVINAAAYTAVDRAESEEALATCINATAVGVLANELQRYGGQLIHISTDFVFDGSSTHAYRPDDRTCPLSAYGRSKAAGEVAAGPNALIVRTSWVYAAGASNFVNTMLDLMRKREEIRVVVDQIGCPTWASGLAQTLWKFTDTNRSGIFHHSDAGVASWYDFAVAVQEEALLIGLLSRKIPVVPISTEQYPTPAKRPALSLLNDGLTRDLLGDVSAHWRENLRIMLKQQMQMVMAG
jgi:dTDP-4-dehydrorhamnose reductase